VQDGPRAERSGPGAAPVAEPALGDECDGGVAVPLLERRVPGLALQSTSVMQMPGAHLVRRTATVIRRHPARVGAAWQPAARRAPQPWLGAGRTGGALHLAFQANDRASVQRFHAAALAASGKDNGKPGPRPSYGETYYAAFVLDPGGHSVEAVCLRAE